MANLKQPHLTGVVWEFRPWDFFGVWNLEFGIFKYGLANTTGTHNAMNFSHFFIRRPIFAAVLSIVIVLVGGIAMFQLPIAQYPEIAPPTVVVRAVYPGANPKVVAETVATPIEQEVNGVENIDRKSVV